MKTCIKKIARILVVSVLLINHVAGFAQTMDKPYIDKFTNDTTFLTTKEIIARQATGDYYIQLETYFSKLHGVITLHVIAELPQAAYSRFHVSAGNSVLIKMTDNTLITLSNLSNIKAATVEIHGGFLGQGNTCWGADVILNPSSEDLQKLSSYAITGVRVKTDKANQDFDIIPKYGDTIKYMVGLITTAK